MHVYTIHVQRHAPTPDRNMVVVCEGFCWPAFVAAPLWAFANRMWFPALGVLAIYLLVFWGAGLAGLGPVTAFALVVGAGAIVGFCANDWRRMTLESRGWYFAGFAAAPNQDAALRRFVDLNPEVLNSPMQAPTY